MRRPCKPSTLCTGIARGGAVIGRRLCFSLLLFAAIAAAEDSSSSTELRPRQYSLVAGGDIMLGGRLHYARHRHGAEWILGRTRQLIANSDMGNFLFPSMWEPAARFSFLVELQFEESGFRRLTLHPLYNQGPQVDLAVGDQAGYVRELLRQHSAALAPIDLERRGEALTIVLEPPVRKETPRRQPPKIHVSGTTQPLPDVLRRRSTSVHPEAAPDWTAGFAPQSLNNGIAVIGTDLPEHAVHSKGIPIAIALRTTALSNDCWEGILEFRHVATGAIHRWWHPIADGAAEPADWQDEKVVIDRTYVRTLLPAGRYKCYWGICPVPLNGNPLHPEPIVEPQLVEIGRIHVRPMSIVALLKSGKAGARITVTRLLLLASAFAIAGVVGAVAVLLWQRRRRSLQPE